MAKHARTAPVSASSLLEALQLYDHDLGRRVDLELLGDVTMLSADVTVPLIVTTECLLFGVASEAGAKVKLVATTLLQSLACINRSVSSFEFACAEAAALAALKDDGKD